MHTYVAAESERTELGFLGNIISHISFFKFFDNCKNCSGLGSLLPPNLLNFVVDITNIVCPATSEFQLDWQAILIWHRSSHF